MKTPLSARLTIFFLLYFNSTLTCRIPVREKNAVQTRFYFFEKKQNKTIGARGVHTVWKSLAPPPSRRLVLYEILFAVVSGHDFEKFSHGINGILFIPMDIYIHFGGTRTEFTTTTRKKKKLFVLTVYRCRKYIRSGRWSLVAGEYSTVYIFRVLNHNGRFRRRRRPRTTFYGFIIARTGRW